MGELVGSRPTTPVGVGVLRPSVNLVAFRRPYTLRPDEVDQLGVSVPVDLTPVSLSHTILPRGLPRGMGETTKGKGVLQEDTNWWTPQCPRFRPSPNLPTQGPLGSSPPPSPSEPVSVGVHVRPTFASDGPTREGGPGSVYGDGLGPTSPRRDRRGVRV